MVKNATVKKSLFLAIALLICLSFVFAACDGAAEFKPVERPAAGAVESNGGIAVKYGDYIYYVNGYEDDVSADNSYSQADGRIGSVVRIKVEDIEAILAINDETLTSTKKSEKILATLREKAQLVVPNICYSANTTSTDLNGIFIFNDRIYITTPNDELTSGGNTLTSQSVLMSYDLGGGDPQRHFVFTSNSAQIWLDLVDGKVVASYFMDNKLYSLDVASGESTLVSKEDETVSSVNFDKAGKCIFFLDSDGSICKLDLGAKEYSVLVKNEIPEGHDHAHSSYTITSVNNGYVYYTFAGESNPSLDNVVLYYASSSEQGVALATNSISGARGWGKGVVYVKSISSESGTYYGIYVTSGDGKEIRTIVSPQYNDSSITFNKLEGDILYYTADSVQYTIDLSSATESKEGTPYARSLAAATGWGAPDIVGDYVFSFGTGTVSVVKFDADKKTNSTSTSFTVIVETEEETK